MTEEIYQTWQRLASLEETVWSRDGQVATTVGARGELREVWLDPRIYLGADAELLAATVLETIRDAARLARRRAFDVVAPLLDRHASAEDADLAFGPILHHLGAGKGAAAWTASTWTPTGRPTR